jgi:hypothetical protein
MYERSVDGSTREWRKTMLGRAGELGGGVDCGDELVGVACETWLVWHAIMGPKRRLLKSTMLGHVRLHPSCFARGGTFTIHILSMTKHQDKKGSNDLLVCPMEFENTPYGFWIYETYGRSQ